MKVSKNKKENKVTFAVDGSLSLPNITNIHSELLKNSTDFDNVLIQGKDITDIDLSFVQLVYSLRKNKNVELKLELNEEQISILNIAGIKEFNI
jgi:hypothetical protein